MIKYKHVFHYSDYSMQDILLYHTTPPSSYYFINLWTTSAGTITKCVSHEVVESTSKPDPAWYGWVLVTRAIFTGGIVAVVIYCQQHKVGHREEEPHKRQHIRRNPPWTNLKSRGLGLIQTGLFMQVLGLCVWQFTSNSLMALNFSWSRALTLLKLRLCPLLIGVRSLPWPQCSRTGAWHSCWVGWCPVHCTVQRKEKVLKQIVHRTWLSIFVSKISHCL